MTNELGSVACSLWPALTVLAHWTGAWLGLRAMLQNIYGAADGSKTSSRTECPKAIGVWPDAFLTSLTMHLWMQSAKLGSYSTAEDRAGGSLSPNPGGSSLPADLR